MSRPLPARAQARLMALLLGVLALLPPPGRGESFPERSERFQKDLAVSLLKPLDAVPDLAPLEAAAGAVPEAEQTAASETLSRLRRLHGLLKELKHTAPPERVEPLLDELGPGLGVKEEDRSPLPALYKDLAARRQAAREKVEEEARTYRREIARLPLGQAQALMEEQRALDALIAAEDWPSAQGASKRLFDNFLRTVSEKSVTVPVKVQHLQARASYEHLITAQPKRLSPDAIMVPGTAEAARAASAERERVAGVLELDLGSRPDLRQRARKLLEETPEGLEATLAWLGKAYALLKETPQHDDIRREQNTASLLYRAAGDKFLEHLDFLAQVKDYQRRLREAQGEEKTDLMLEYAEFLRERGPTLDFEALYDQANEEVRRLSAVRDSLLETILKTKAGSLRAEDAVKGGGGLSLLDRVSDGTASDEDRSELARLLLGQGAAVDEALSPLLEDLERNQMALGQALSARDSALEYLRGESLPRDFWKADWQAQIADLPDGHHRRLTALMEDYLRGEEGSERRLRGREALLLLLQNPPQDLLDKLRAARVEIPGPLAGDYSEDAKVSYALYEPDPRKATPFYDEGSLRGEPVETVRSAPKEAVSQDCVFLKRPGLLIRDSAQGDKLLRLIHDPAARKQVFLQFEGGRLLWAQVSHLDEEGKVLWKVVHQPAGAGEFIKVWYDAGGRKVLEQFPPGAVSKDPAAKERLWVIHRHTCLGQAPGERCLKDIPAELLGEDPWELRSLNEALRKIFLERQDAVVPGLREEPVFYDPDQRRGFAMTKATYDDPRGGLNRRITYGAEFEFFLSPYRPGAGGGQLFFKGSYTQRGDRGQAILYHDKDKPYYKDEGYDVRYEFSPNSQGNMVYIIDQKYGTKDTASRWARESSLTDTTIAWVASLVHPDKEMRKELSRMAEKGLEHYSKKSFLSRFLEAADTAMLVFAVADVPAQLGKIAVAETVAKSGVREALLASGRYTEAQVAQLLRGKTTEDLLRMRRLMRADPASFIENPAGLPWPFNAALRRGLRQGEERLEALQREKEALLAELRGAKAADVSELGRRLNEIERRVKALKEGQGLLLEQSRRSVPESVTGRKGEIDVKTRELQRLRGEASKPHLGGAKRRDLEALIRARQLEIEHLQALNREAMQKHLQAARRGEQYDRAFSEISSAPGPGGRALRNFQGPEELEARVVKYAQELGLEGLPRQKALRYVREANSLIALESPHARVFTRMDGPLVKVDLNTGRTVVYDETHLVTYMRPKDTSPAGLMRHLHELATREGGGIAQAEIGAVRKAILDIAKTSGRAPPPDVLRWLNAPRTPKVLAVDPRRAVFEDLAREHKLTVGEVEARLARLEAKSGDDLSKLASESELHKLLDDTLGMDKILRLEGYTPPSGKLLTPQQKFIDDVQGVISERSGDSIEEISRVSAFVYPKGPNFSLASVAKIPDLHIKYPRTYPVRMEISIKEGRLVVTVQRDGARSAESYAGSLKSWLREKEGGAQGVKFVDEFAGDGL